MSNTSSGDSVKSEAMRRGLLTARTIRAVHAWDALTNVTLIFVATFTPFEIAFLPAQTSPNDELFILGRIVDCIFSDMLLQLFLMVPKKGEEDILETRWHVILRRYLSEVGSPSISSRSSPRCSTSSLSAWTTVAIYDFVDNGRLNIEYTLRVHIAARHSESCAS